MESKQAHGDFIPEGLSQAEAKARLAKDGPNVLVSEKRAGPWRLIFNVLREPMFMLLVGAAIIYLLLGDLGEAIALSGAVLIMVAVTVIQEGRTARALDALKELTSPRAHTLRDGQWVMLPAPELVTGDVVRISEGDRVPADAVLREGLSVSVDESMLTGESTSVHKRAERVLSKPEAPGGEGRYTLFSGSLVVAGQGIGEIIATGAHTEIGRIGAALHTIEDRRTPLQREIAKIVKYMAIFGLSVSVVLVLIGGFLGGDWLQALLSGITLSMSLLPEELPVVLTVFLALGAWRLSKHGVLTRRPVAVETLGSVTVLCTDKTGTLTENNMAIRRLVVEDSDVTVTTEKLSLDPKIDALLTYGFLACPRLPIDPMDKAFLTLRLAQPEALKVVDANAASVAFYPLTPELLAVTYVWQAHDSNTLVVASKGAPEAVLSLCNVPDDKAKVWLERTEHLAASGLRVLGVAHAQHQGTTPAATPHDYQFEFLGLVGLEDPLRADAKNAVQLAQQAGVRIVMITGDHQQTATAIADQAGLAQGEVHSGADLDALDDAQLTLTLKTTRAVARAVPAHKLRIVRALQAAGEVVGMTGDGVNDAPALKASDVGIAMGARGTDVAREASAIVLVRDEFLSLVQGIRQGRHIDENLRKAMGFVFAVHVPIALMAIVPALFGWKPLLLPLHVVFLELVIDPACSIVFEMEPEEDDVMKHQPRSKKGALFGWRRMAWSACMGLGAALGALGLLFWLKHQGADVLMLRSVAFLSLVIGNVFLLLVHRSVDKPFWKEMFRRNPALLWLLSGVVVTQIIIWCVPAARQLFSVGPMTWQWALAGAGCVIGPVVTIACIKAWVTSSVFSKPA